MTREELKMLHDAIWRHDQAQREEIAQLREALERIKRITQVHSSYLALDVCTLAQAALAKEATHEPAK